MTECQPYFQYDQIEWYRNSIPEDQVWNILQKKNRSDAEIKAFHLLVRGVVNKISDTLILSDLESLGYKKKFLNSNKFSEIDKIFCKRKHREVLYTSCEPVYRDILVFKNQNQIKGVANICFNCGQNIIFGTTKSTSEFGQSGDYQKLLQLLLQ